LILDPPMAARVIGRAPAEELLRRDTPESSKLTFRCCFGPTPGRAPHHRQSKTTRLAPIWKRKI